MEMYIIYQSQAIYEFNYFLPWETNTTLKVFGKGPQKEINNQRNTLATYFTFLNVAAF